MDEFKKGTSAIIVLWAGILAFYAGCVAFLIWAIVKLLQHFGVI